MMTNRNRESMDNTNLVFSTQTKTSACHYLYLYGLCKFTFFYHDLLCQWKIPIYCYFHLWFTHVLNLWLHDLNWTISCNTLFHNSNDCFLLQVLKLLISSPARVPAPCGMWKDCTLLADKRYADITRNCTSYYTCHGGTYFGHNFCNPGMYHTFTEIREHAIYHLYNHLDVV